MKNDWREDCRKDIEVLVRRQRGRRSICVRDGFPCCKICENCGVPLCEHSERALVGVDVCPRLSGCGCADAYGEGCPLCVK